MAGLCHDTIEEGHIVCALQQGVPNSYTKSITDLGILIPDGYDEWKKQIITMNCERQCKQVQDSIQGVNQDRKVWNDRKSNTAGVSKGNSGTTTLLGNKKTTMGTTYGSRGQAMDIDTLCAEGKCFQCQQKGHLSKNCPLQSWNKGKKREERRASMTELATDSKIKEVKDTAKK
ncbi:hypothetical protein ARMSODRAFT_983201 [Armillaria solidipes]|uniref:CCHC-type domain-containing protein n=1 Tax=Armillaria solidipes TaxID=1076256 RepID=A0A2H3AK23_9AGAR|nr:hypothetical protein ARMSODRAFT_983201 [Armillaria solidipes]